MKVKKRLELKISAMTIQTRNVVQSIPRQECGRKAFYSEKTELDVFP